MSVDLKSKNDVKIQKPKKYAVIMLNDDFTPIEFVMELLIRIFNKQADEAAKLTMDIHKKGKCVAGVYTYEIAETKMIMAENAVKQEEHVLRLVIEEV